MTHTQPIRCAECWGKINSKDAFWKHYMQGTICQKQRENISSTDLINSDFLLPPSSGLPFYLVAEVVEDEVTIFEAFPNDGEDPSPYDRHSQPLISRFVPNLLRDTLSPGMTQ